MSAIKIENLSKTYPPNFPRLKRFFRLSVKDEVEALRNVSLEIADGEIFGLIGKNGAGKTTLTKIIATLVQPTSGKVSVKGFDSIADEVKVRSLIGLATAEERSFYWRLSCERNMLFFARLYAMDDKTAKKRIGEIFERLNLTELKARRFSELSTGNKQKLAVARALLPKPPSLTFGRTDALARSAGGGGNAKSDCFAGKCFRAFDFAQSRRNRRTLRPRGDHFKRRNPRR